MPATDQNNNAATASPSFEVKVNDAVVPAGYNLVSMMVYSAVNRLAHARFVFLDGDAATADFILSNKPDFLPGSTIVISAGYEGLNQPVFSGMVIKHSIQLKENKSTFLVIDCRHNAVKATKTRKSKIFSAQTDGDIFSSILRPYGISADIADTSPQYEEMVQFNCTDWDFIVSRAEANGLLVIANNDQLKITRPDFSTTPVMDLRFGNNLFEFDIEMDARNQFDTVNAWAWDPANQDAASAAGNHPSGMQQLGNVSTSGLSGTTGDSAIDLKTSALVTETELRTWASARQTQYDLSKIQGRIKCQGNAALQPGVLVNLVGTGNRFSGKAYVSAVRHEINQGNWLTDVQIGLGASQFIKEYDVNAFPAEGMLPAANGLQVGVVTQIENDPLGEYRVLVRLPLVDPNAEGIWARQALLDAGDGRGSFFRPEVGDEVVLGFVNDDPRNAILLGGVNSSAKQAVIEPKDTNNEKGFVTREKMKLWFDDGTKVMTLSTPAGNTVQLDEGNMQISIKDQNGNEFTMSKDGISLKSIKDITLEGPSGKVSISAKDFEASASLSSTVKGNSSAEISSGGTTTVKGATVMIN